MRESRTVGLVGCGSWGRFILRDLVLLGCRVSAVARSPESRARGEGAETIVGSVAERHEVEGIVVATPTSTHAAVVGEALEHGVPVFVEKPLANDPAAADRLFAQGGRGAVGDGKW